MSRKTKGKQRTCAPAECPTDEDAGAVKVTSSFSSHIATRKGNYTKNVTETRSSRMSGDVDPLEMPVMDEEVHIYCFCHTSAFCINEGQISVSLSIST